MKRILLGLTLMALLTSCASVDKMLEQGDYDGVIAKATKKMSGKKKKDVHVMAVEDAFEKITRRDMARIEALRLNQSPEDWERIIRIANDIDRRQRKVEPFLPLVSENGYQAKFTFVQTDKIVAEAKTAAADLYEDRLTELVTFARNGDKRSAREAYSLIDHIRTLHPNRYRPALRDEMWSLGINKVLIRIENQSQAFLPRGLAEEMLAADVHNLGGSWDRFYTEMEEPAQADYEVVFRLLDMSTSPDLWEEHVHAHQKDIVDGWEYVLDERGNVKKDSLGNDIKRDRIVTVKATVVELVQSKRALIRARMDVVHVASNAKVMSKPLELEDIFTHTSRQFFGDERALKSELRTRILPVAFPSETQMITEAMRGIKPQFFREMKNARYTI